MSKAMAIARRSGTEPRRMPPTADSAADQVCLDTMEAVTA